MARASLAYMAKNPTTFHFHRSGTDNPSLGFLWVRVPDSNFAGFDGSLTITRIRLTYKMTFISSVNSNGQANEHPVIAVDITNGDPPAQPNYLPGAQSIIRNTIFEETPHLVDATPAGGGGLHTTYENHSAEVDIKAQRRIPANPESAAVWWGWSLKATGGGITNAVVVWNVTGTIIRLDAL